MGGKSSGLNKESYIKLLEKEEELMAIADKSGKKDGFGGEDLSWKRSSNTVSRPQNEPYRAIEQIVEEITESDSEMPNKQALK